MAGIIITIIALSCPVAHALDPERMLSQYNQRVWTREDGLPQNTVRSLAQTVDGYLWVGTEQGLARFDGVRFVPMELRTHDGRIDGFTNVLYADGDRLWAGTPNGLYRLTGDGFVEVLGPEEKSVGEVRAIFRDSQSRLWIGTEGRLFRVFDNRIEVFSDTNGVGLDGVTSISESAVAGLCFAADDVLCLSDGGLSKLAVLVDAADEIRSVYQAVDKNGALWVIETGSRLKRIDDSQVRRWGKAEGLPDEFIRSLLVDRENAVWFGLGASGLARIGRRGVEMLAGPRGHSSIEAVALLEDREGNLWVGTSGDGLIRLSDGLFSTFSVDEGLLERSVRTVMEDRQGVVWIGTAGGGLHSLVDGSITVHGPEVGLPTGDIMSLAFDNRDRLWVGTGGAGLFVRESGRFVNVPSVGRVVFSLHEDLKGRMWVGRLGGVDRSRGEEFQPVESLRLVNAADIENRGDSEVLFADGRGGVMVWRDGGVSRLGEEQGFPGDMTLAIHIDSDDGLWVGSHLSGLTYSADDTVFRFTTDHGLCDDSVFSILEDDFGRLWMSSNLGVFAVEKDHLLAVARGEAATVDCRLFGAAEGMRSAECNGGQSPVAWKDRAGRLWFATGDGVVRVDPGEIAEAEVPRVRVEHAASGDQTTIIDESVEEITFSPDQRELSIRYTAMTLTKAEQVRFRFRLIGLHDDWVEVGDRREAYFVNLSPRRYRFEVQARVPGSPWSEKPAGLDFEITPRFFETRWFMALVGLAVAGIAAGGYRMRVGALYRRQQHLKALVAERTLELEQVNSTLEERVTRGIEALRESDRMAAYGHLVAGVAHEVRHPIFALRAAAHLLTTKLADSDLVGDELDIVGRETERISRLVDDLLELGRPRELEIVPCSVAELIDEAAASLSNNPEIDLPLVKTQVDPSLAVMADRPAVIQVLVNLVGNACRHAIGATQVKISVAVDESGEATSLTVADDGAGISVTDQSKIFEPFFSGTGGTGLGLAIASRLVRGHGGKLTVDSILGEGTVFTIELRQAR